MFNSILPKVLGFFSVPRADENPDLLKAQCEVFSRQIPVMYSILLISAWAVSFTYVQVAPTWLSVYVPIAFSAVSILRVLNWWRARGREMNAVTARAALIRTNWVAAIMAIGISTWSVTLSPYGDTEMQASVAFFMAITGVCVVVCLLHLRSAATMVALSILTAFTYHFGLSGVPSFVAMSTNLFFAFTALLMVVFVQSRYFETSVEAHTSLEAASAENYRLANMDSLTGLANRRQFFKSLRKQLDSARAEGKQLAVGVLDLDGFKPVNDLYGHAVGDQLLVEVGKRLQELNNENVLVSRLGGDEFAIIVYDYISNENLIAAGEDLCVSMREPFVLDGATVQISVSIGVCVFPELAADPRALYERADYALYKAKQVNRGHTVLFSDIQIAEIERNARLEQVLRTADLDNELSVSFQPIVEASSGNTVAFEALARWHSAELGTVSPAAFIPVMERAGMIGRVTRILLEKALAEAANWPNEVRLSFNLSTHDVCSSEGINRIVGIVHASGMDPARIDFEITETAMMYDFIEACAAIETLKRLGCGIALDDFGTGYSSLSQLHSLPLTKIKIDRSFVSNIDSNPASYKIVKSLIALSRDMELSCVIEGVETQAELSTVSKLGGDLIQGYLYSKPMDAGSVAAFLNGRKKAKSA